MPGRSWRKFREESKAAHATRSRSPLPWVPSTACSSASASRPRCRSSPGGTRSPPPARCRSACAANRRDSTGACRFGIHPRRGFAPSSTPRQFVLTAAERSVRTAHPCRSFATNGSPSPAIRPTCAHQTACGCSSTWPSQAKTWKSPCLRRTANTTCECGQPMRSVAATKRARCFASRTDAPTSSISSASIRRGSTKRLSTARHRTSSSRRPSREFERGWMRLRRSGQRRCGYLRSQRRPRTISAMP